MLYVIAYFSKKDLRDLLKVNLRLINHRVILNYFLLAAIKLFY